MAICRFYRDPLRKFDSKCSKTAITLIFHEIKTSQIKIYQPKPMLTNQTSLRLVLKLIYARKGSR